MRGKITRLSSLDSIKPIKATKPAKHIKTTSPVDAVLKVAKFSTPVKATKPPQSAYQDDTKPINMFWHYATRKRMPIVTGTYIVIATQGIPAYEKVYMQSLGYHPVKSGWLMLSCIELDDEKIDAMVDALSRVKCISAHKTYIVYK